MNTKSASDEEGIKIQPLLVPLAMNVSEAEAGVVLLDLSSSTLWALS